MKGNNMKKLSLIIPVYNTEKYLKDCLKSIVYDKDLEVIIIDDGSTDNSASVYSKYSDIENVIIVKNENHGVSYSRNVGISKASGEYIMFLDADDLLINNWYKKFIKSVSDEDFIIFSQKYKNDDYNKTDLLKSCCGYITGISIDDCYLQSVWSKIYKRDILVKNNILFDEEIINGEDLLFNLSVIRVSNRIKIIDKSIYIVRKNIYSSTNRYNSNLIKSNNRFIKKSKKLLSSLEKQEQNNILDFQNINGFYIIINNICKSNINNKLSIINTLYNRLNVKEINLRILSKASINKFEKLILILVKKNHIKMAMNLLILKNNLKHNYGKEFILERV